MSYYGDARDALEAAYPSCTSFVRYHPRPTAAGLARRSRGLVMVLDFADPSALERFKLVCYAIEDSPSWREFRFDVYDHAGLEDALPILEAHGGAGGTGELFGVWDGRIVAALTGEFSWPRFDEFTATLHANSPRAASS